MKKLTVLSIMAASFLLVGCGDAATGAEAKAATEHKTESSAKTHEETKSAATETKEAATTAVEKTTEAVAQKATEAKEAATKAIEKTTEAVAQKATEAVESVKEKASSAVDSAKAAATSVASAVTDATKSGPDGKAIFAKCAGCHGADGKTSAMGKSAIIAGQSAADLEKKIAGYKAGTRNAHGMGMLMKGQVASLSDSDIKAVATYISGL